MARKPGVKKFICKICGTTTYSDTKASECAACGANDFTTLYEAPPISPNFDHTTLKLAYIIGNTLGFVIAASVIFGIGFGIWEIIKLLAM